MEGRGPQLKRDLNGKKPLSPNSMRFSTKLKTLAERARRIRHEPLRTMVHYIDHEWLKESWKRIRKGAAFGIDEVSAREYEKDLDSNLNRLLEDLKRGRYRAQPVKRVYIPKADGSQRPLGIPTIEDKVAQRAVGLMVSAIFEQEFLPMSYGFRQGKNAHQAVEAVKAAIATRKVSWVVDADIKSFFDEMDHRWLMKFVGHRIGNKPILRLVGKWLKAGVMEEGNLSKVSTGAPQGGVISPALANIYLHYVIDLWYEKVVKKHMRGETHGFRYADDILFCFQYRQDAIRFMQALRGRLSKFGLRLNEEKSRLLRFGRYAERDRKIRGEKRATFQFLGFTFYNKLSRNSKYTVGLRTASKRLSRSMNAVTSWCKENRHQPLEWQRRYLNSVLSGHYLYYGVTGNFRSVAAFYRHAIWAWHRYLSRRSQRAYIRWEKFRQILKDHPLVKPRIVHSVYGSQTTLLLQ